MTEYQVFARKYRPQKFSDVVAQEVIVLTLIHALQSNRLGHAYLFAGPHGTGKTSLARLFAKALNCKDISSDYEPCNECASCKEIAGGYSLDVLEIDGASHRGIEDIRRLNETMAYTPSVGKYKIYIIDEVHMLTKEAFNALLKSLEEPPSHVKFFFATTEANLIPQTILSRCQRFNLKRIPPQKIVEKLSKIALDLNITVENEALALLATLAEGGLRDAESLFDELVSFQKGKITKEGVRELFGLAEEELFFTLDRAGIQGDFVKAFDIVEHIFSSGKNIHFFLEELTQHFRILFLLKVGGKLEITAEGYKEALACYNKEQLLEILEILMIAQHEVKLTPSKRTFLETLLLRILNTHKRSSLEDLLLRLEDLEKRLAPLSQSTEKPSTPTSKAKSLPKEIVSIEIKTPSPIEKTRSLAEELPQNLEKPEKDTLSLKAKSPSQEFTSNEVAQKESNSRKAAALSQELPQNPLLENASEKDKNAPSPIQEEGSSIKEKTRFDTVMRFAAKELKGSLKKEANEAQD